MLDAGLRVVVWNRAAADLTGQPASEVLGRCCRLAEDVVVLDFDAPAVPTLRPLPPGPAAGYDLEIRAGARRGPVRLPVTLIPLRYEGSAVLILFRTAPWASGKNGAGALRPAEAASLLLRRLTERETEILALLAAGKTAKAIARELGLSVPTVRTHTQHILRKLGVHSSLEAAVWFLKASSETSTETSSGPVPSGT